MISKLISEVFGHTDPADITKGGQCMANKNGNREYQSDVFSMLLADKSRALEVYNAMNGTSYNDPELIEITTLEDRSFSLTVRNDASFVLDNSLSLYGHQSTYCPNMPLRDLIYFANMIQKRVHAQKRDLYGKSLAKIPMPHFVVFYNGKESAPERYELRLSNAFEKKAGTPELELVCQVYNINKGNNTDLLAKCPTLRDYMYFVDLVRNYHFQNGFIDLENAIRQAIDQCIRENVLKDFLIENRTEVTHVMTLDFTFERRLELQRAEAEEEGMQQKLTEQIQKKIYKGKSLEQIADELEETPDAIRSLYEQVKEEMADRS